jgi:hypothetical protein
MKKVILILIVTLALNTYANNCLMYYICLVDNAGNEFDFSTQPYDNVTFKYWISSRPTEVCDQNDWQCGYETFDMGISAIFLDLQNFTTNWSPGDILNVLIKQDDNPFDHLYCSAQLNLTIDGESTTWIGFDKYLGPENGGMPIYVTPISGGSPVSIMPNTSVESDILTISWDTVPEATGYYIYSSDDPYGTFSYLATSPTTSWQTTVTESRKFFYVTATNDVKKKAENTIEVKKEN